MSKTRLTLLRKAAPGSLTATDVAAFFRKRRFPRSPQTIINFERGQFLSPPDRFFELFAEAVGTDIDTVREAHRVTLLQRQRQTGPFS